MMKKNVKKTPSITERGQVIILIALAIVGLVGMVGLVTDTGLLLIQYGKLKRGVDAASVAAAQQYRVVGSGSSLDPVALQNTAKNFLELNLASTNPTDNVTVQDPVTSLSVHSCDPADTARPSLCNPVADIYTNTTKNRKLVEVTASTDVQFGFLRLLGINSTTLTATAIGEAASIDIVLVIDTSASMAYETTFLSGPEAAGGWDTNDGIDDSGNICNPTFQCQPMQSVKSVAISFINTLYFPYDRVAVITTTSQSKGTSDWAGARYPVEVTPLNASLSSLTNFINGIKVFEPRDCVLNDYTTQGPCMGPVDPASSLTSAYMNCPTIVSPGGSDVQALTSNYLDPSSCLSSDIGDALTLAHSALTGSGNPANQRLDSFWAVMGVFSGPPNATVTTVSLPSGYCPKNLWWPTPVAPATKAGRCRDGDPYVRHHVSDTTSFTFNTLQGGSTTETVSTYDPDDYTRDQADNLATSISGQGVTIYTVGLGGAVESTDYLTNAAAPPPTEALLRYIAQCAGEGSPDDCRTPVSPERINHGQFFYSPTTSGLAAIFKAIANNIATKISQ